MRLDDDYINVRAVNRPLLILATLMYLNASGDYPTATELVRESDPRKNIPKPTIADRRAMINHMREDGLIEIEPIPSSRFKHLRITQAGIDFVRSEGRES